MTHTHDATVVITTKNRKDELRVAIESALSQEGSVEVLVIDDGSTDGTAEMVQKDYPRARVDRVEQSLGLIRQRNRAAQLAGGRIVFSIDDDAAFTSPRVVSQTLEDFKHPRVGAVAIPFCNVKYGPEVYQRSPDPAVVYCQQQFIGTAHALRRDLFLALGGYRAHYFHQGEERDWAIRALAAGYVVRMGNADRIDHFESPKRDRTRMDIYGRRNDVLFIWHNTPLLGLPWHLFLQTAGGLSHAKRTGRWKNQFIGLWRGYGGMFAFASYRQPVPSTIFSLYRKLRKHTPLAEFEAILPELVPIEKITAIRQVP